MVDEALKTYKLMSIIFYNANNEILVQNRKSISRWGEDWGLFGGHLNDDESFESCVIREIKEELNYDLTNSDSVFEEIGEFKDDYQDNIYHVKLYASKLPKDWENEFILTEGDDMKLFSCSDAKKLNLIPNHASKIEFFEKYLIKKNWELEK